MELSFDIKAATKPFEDLVRERAGKLEKICDYLSSCRVAVEEKQKYMESGTPYRVRVDLTVPPKHELVAVTEPGQGEMHDDLSSVIIRTFEAAERQLNKLVEKQRGEVKSHPAQQKVGIVSRIFPEEGYGFLRKEDEEDIYFHRNSVLNDEFDKMSVGTAARYVLETGDEGPQASTVQVIGKPSREDALQAGDVE